MSTKPDKNSESKTKNKNSKSENKNKKSKEKPIIKVPVLAEERITEGTTSWDNMFVINSFKDSDFTKYWKGKFLMSENNLVITSSNKAFKKKYDIKNIIGILESPFHKKLISIGILEESMIYLLLHCTDIKDKDKIMMEFEALKKKNENNSIYQNIEGHRTPDIIENEMDDTYTHIIVNQDDKEVGTSRTYETPIISAKSPVQSIEKPEIYVNQDDKEVGTSRTYETSIISAKSPVQSIEKPEIYINQNKYIIENRTPVMKTNPAIIMNTELDDNTFDSFQFEKRNLNSENVMWIENTKYIDYSPSLGMNIQSDDGPIYIYCAHQVGPTINEYYSDNSESD